jgi:hypothetical protein
VIIQVQDGSQDIGLVERGNMEDSNEILIKKEFIPTMRMFLDDVVKAQPETILLVGQSHGRNRDSTATLMTRYLRKIRVPMKHII